MEINENSVFKEIMREAVGKEIPLKNCMNEIKTEIKEIWFGPMSLLLIVYPMVSFGLLFHLTYKIAFITSVLFKIS